MCVFFPFILGIKFVGRTSRSHTGARSHKISHPPSYVDALMFFLKNNEQYILTKREFRTIDMVGMTKIFERVSWGGVSLEYISPNTPVFDPPRFDLSIGPF